MSRYPPPQRDRSPPRFSDRRPSLNYGAPPGPRNPSNSNQSSIDREPPRGPKAHFDTAPRGRGAFTKGSFGGRADYRDRDRDRDARPPLNPLRRDDDRPDWPRRDRDFNPADRGGFASRGNRSYVGRDRSASPVRARRESSEALSTQGSRTDGPPPYYSLSSRGSYTGGRGRGDYDRSSGRGSFVGERDRDGPVARSRSREDWGIRDRDRGRDLDLDRKDRPERWDNDVDRDRELKPRTYDSWQRDRSTGGNSSGSAGIPSSQTMNSTVGDQTAQRATFDPSRRRSTAFTPAVRDWKREGDSGDYFSRTEQSRELGVPRKPSPPPIVQSAASSGLDYGPPPATKTIENTSETSVAAWPSNSKVEQTSTNPTPFLPPTGPKAERAVPQPPTQPQALKVAGSEPWAKPDIQPRIIRPAPITPVAIPRLQEQTRSQDDNRDRMDIDRQPPSSIPSGPRAGILSNKTRIMQQQTTSPATPPIGANSMNKTSSVEFRTPIPTGPRSDRDGPKARPGAARTLSNAIWTSPEYKPPRPSIMNNLQSKPYQLEARELQSQTGSIPRSGPSIFNQQQKPRIYQPSIMQRSRDVHEPNRRVDASNSRVLVTDSNGIAVKQDEDATDMMDLDVAINNLSEEEAADDDGFDDEYYHDLEEKHQRERQLWEGRKPPVENYEDAEIVDMLVKIQFLEWIISGNIESIDELMGLSDSSAETAETTETAEIATIGETMESAPQQIGLPSPERQPGEPQLAKDLQHILGRPLSKAPINPILTPPLESLPFSSQQIRLDIPFEESDNEVEHENMMTIIRQEFEQAAWDHRDELERVHSIYDREYRHWKYSVSDLERLQVEAKQPTPRPLTPIPPIGVGVPAPLTSERPSRTRNMTEHDIEQTMRISEQTAKEDEEKRQREDPSGARPNDDSEAVVPDMLDRSEIEHPTFTDENWKIPQSQALDQFAYIPPEDDFDEEEQLSFVKEFITWPKKWGKIAECLPGRTYQQCIMHYYLTKNVADYKETLRINMPKRKRGRMPAKRSTALLGDLTSDAGGLPIAMTDSGRPRRAAAPTFGEVGTDSEALTPGPTGAKLRGGNSTKDGVDASGDKAATRGGKKGVSNKRKSKKALLEQQVKQVQNTTSTDTSPQKVERHIPRLEDLKIGPNRFKNLHSQVELAQNMEVQNSIELEMIHVPAFQDDKSSMMSGLSTSITGPQITSYWSVPEQQKFPALIAYFGKDFSAIADFMKTKSGTMIKNFYARQLSEGKKDLEDLARESDAKRERGEPMGPPPTPVAPPKRRYEATPSMALPRSMASIPPNSDIPIMDSAMQGVIATGGSTMIDDFPPNAVQRSARGDMVAKPRSSRDIPGLIMSTSNLQQRVEDGPQGSRSHILQPRQPQGPRPGFFSDDGVEVRPASQGMPRTIQEQPSSLGASTRRSDLEQFEPMRQSQSFLQQHHHNSPTGHDALVRSQQQADHGRHSFISTEQARDGFGHARQDSSGVAAAQTSAQPREIREREGDMMELRRHEPPHRGLQYGHMPTQPPLSSLHSGTEVRIEVARPASTPLAASQEPPKQAAPKRSNLMNILNEEPSEPAPPKRASLDGYRGHNNQSPSLMAPSQQEGMLQQARREAPQDQNQISRHGSRSHYVQSANLGQTAGRPTQKMAGDYTPGFSGSPAPSSNIDWIERWDPRRQSGAGDQGTPQPQATPAPYSTASHPLSTISSVQRQAVDMSARQEPLHRASMFGQMQHRGHAPSPPPVATATQNRIGPAPYRSSSGSSQHNRVSSLGGFHQNTSQIPTQIRSGGPGSAGSTPVSSMHSGHQSRTSLTGYDERHQQQRDQYRQEQQLANARQQEALQAQLQQQQRRDYDLQQHLILRQQQAQEMEQDRFRHPGPPRVYTPPNGHYAKQAVPGQAQGQGQASHFRHYSQGGTGQEERR